MSRTDEGDERFRALARITQLLFQCEQALRCVTLSMKGARRRLCREEVIADAQDAPVDPTLLALAESSGTTHRPLKYVHLAYAGRTVVATALAESGYVTLSADEALDPLVAVEALGRLVRPV